MLSKQKSGDAFSFNIFDTFLTIWNENYERANYSRTIWQKYFIHFG